MREKRFCDYCGLELKKLRDCPCSSYERRQFINAGGRGAAAAMSKRMAAKTTFLSNKSVRLSPK